MKKEKGKKKINRYYLAVGGLALMAFLGVHLGVTLYTARPVQRLERPDIGQEDRKEDLYVTLDEEKVPFTATIKARKRTAQENKELLEKAKQKLQAELKGENDSLDAVTKPLYMPSSAEGGEIVVSWSSDCPEILSYDGSLGEEIPKAGKTVQLEAVLSGDGMADRFTAQVFVLPLEDNSLQGRLKEALQMENPEETKATYMLPATLGGQPLLWYKKGNDPALYVAGAILAVGVLLPWHRKEQQKEARKKYQASLLKMYPTLVSQLVLYMGAGMSISQTFRRIAEGKKGRQPGALEQECQHFIRELAQGVPEQEALYRMGERSGLWEYRTFCGMLIQNRSRGNDSLLPMLQAEAQKAFAERQRRARVLGNEAGTRLLMPMMLMLVVVLLLVLFPAITSFYT